MANETEIVQPTQLPVPTDRPNVVPLSQEEQKYLAQLAATNQQLTVELGNAYMDLKAREAVLHQHRTNMQAAYASSLRIRGIKEGRFDTVNGVILVTEYSENRG